MEKVRSTALESAAMTLFEVYARLRGHFGYQHPWWPGSPLEITLTALLVQQCDWSAAWAGVRRLRQKRFLSLPALAASTPEAVYACIPVSARRTAGMGNVRLVRWSVSVGMVQVVENRVTRLLALSVTRPHAQAFWSTAPGTSHFQGTTYAGPECLSQTRTAALSRYTSLRAEESFRSFC